VVLEEVTHFQWLLVTVELVLLLDQKRQAHSFLDFSRLRTFSTFLASILPAENLAGRVFTTSYIGLFSITEYLATLPKTLIELTNQAVKKC
jgi:hypothetical protein